ncbi:MAG: MlaD family protein [Planctomycetota bacterium]|jgi:phospholipid/cholesterol/gamma-HCH transport system substrate-binding protein/paraquat-inducible protein B
MSEKANYFKIGLFFVISVILIVIAVIVWGAGLFTKDMIYFETYFDSPVTGLTAGSSVELMGVKLGQVEDIDFVPAVYDISTDPTKVSKYERYIRVLCSISAEEAKEYAGDITDVQRKARTKNLIQQGLRLRLASNILTGQAYLEGVFVDPNRFPILPIIWESKHTYVASAPGEFSTIKDSVDKILEKIEEIEFQKIVENVNQLLVVAKETVADANIPGVTEEIKNLFAELRGTNQQIQALLTNPDPNAKSTNIAQVITRLDNTLENINRMLVTERPEVDKFLHNLRVITDDVKELTAMIKQHPSEIIFSQPPAKSEMIE